LGAGRHTVPQLGRGGGDASNPDVVVAVPSGAIQRFAGIAKDRPQGAIQPRKRRPGRGPLTVDLAVPSLGLTIAVTGLAFGLWLLLLGSAILAVSVVGWLAIINQETRRGRPRHDQQP
jgi:hypothetical protein